MSESNARKQAGLSHVHDTHEIHVPGSKSMRTKNQAPEHKKGLELYDNEDTRSTLGEAGSHGIPDSKKRAGGAAQVSNGGPRLTSGDVNPLQRAAQKEHEAAENGLKDTSRRDVYGRKK
jgi:hypothetical protein